VRKILVRNGVAEKDADRAIQPLRDLGGTRNLIAHTGKLGFAAGPEAGYLHPKKVGEVISDDDLLALCERFVAQSEKAFELLKHWLDEISPYLRDFRRLEALASAERAKDET
jgi:hypothetical protein